MPNSYQPPTTRQRITNVNALAALFSNSTCTKTYLGEGDTFFGINQIKDWILQNHDEIKQNEAIALLKGKTLQESVANIHYALNTHFKYDEDGWEQQLRAPNCAWQQRNTGLDCKSFTVLASVFLYKLGIKHYLRKIKQPYLRPNEYSHIYVVVPINQNTTNLKEGYITLDATVNNNVEPIFSKSYDIPMTKLPYYGLKGASNPLKTTITKTAIEGFVNYLQFLAYCGVSTTQIQKIESALNTYLKKGVDPVLKITAKGITVGEYYISYVDPNARFVRFKSAKDVANSFSENPKIGLNSSSNGGGDEIEDLENVLADILEDDWFSNTFGSIFSNGFDLSCYNSSNNPQQSAAEVPIDARYYLQESGLSQNINIDTITRFIYTTGIYLWARAYGRWNPQLAKCTRKGNEVGFKDMLKFRDDIVAAVKNTLQQQNITLDISTRKKISSANVKAPSGYHNGRINVTGQEIEIRIPKLSGTPKDGTSLEGFSIEVNTNTNTGGNQTDPNTNYTNTGTNSGTQDNGEIGSNNGGGSNGNQGPKNGKDNTQQAGFGNLLLGGVLIGTAIYVGTKSMAKQPK